MFCPQMKLYNTKIKLFLFSIFISISSFVFSQNESESICATETSQQFLNHYNSIKKQVKSFEQEFIKMKSNKNYNTRKTLNFIPIKAHIVRTTNHNGGLSETSVIKAIENLNEIYADAFMKFYLFDEINYLDSDELSNFKKGNEQTLIGTNYVPNTINVYFIEAIENSFGESICGYVEEKNNIIIMKNSCAVNDSSLAHEMGHFFSLLHTHGPSNSRLTTELVDGSNCDTDGDGICDTPADPTLSNNTIDDSCNYSGNMKDSHGNFFKPDTRNIMSYSRKSCRNYFSEQQFSRIYGYYKTIEDSLKPDYHEIETENNDLISVKIYPNPVSNDKLFLKVSLENPSINYTITNFQGQTLSQGKTSNKEINVNNLSPGSYLLVLDNGTSSVVRKFIK